MRAGFAIECVCGTEATLSHATQCKAAAVDLVMTKCILSREQTLLSALAEENAPELAPAPQTVPEPLPAGVLLSVVARCLDRVRISDPPFVPAVQNWVKDQEALAAKGDPADLQRLVGPVVMAMPTTKAECRQFLEGPALSWRTLEETHKEFRRRRKAAIKGRSPHGARLSKKKKNLLEKAKDQSPKLSAENLMEQFLAKQEAAAAQARAEESDESEEEEKRKGKRKRDKKDKKKRKKRKKHKKGKKKKADGDSSSGSDSSDSSDSESESDDDE